MYRLVIKTSPKEDRMIAMMKRTLSPVRSVKYHTIKNESNYEQILLQAKSLLKSGYQFKNEPEYLAGQDRVIIFYKPAVDEGFNLVKIDGQSNLIWTMLAELNK